MLQKKIAPLIYKIRPAPVAQFFKKFFQIQRMEVKTSNGLFWVDPVSFLGRALIDQDEYEPEMTKVLKAFLRPGDVFVDVGANEGYFSVIGARLVEEKGKVYAVEPQERIKGILKRNFELNHKAQQIIHIDRAISDRAKVETLHLTPTTNNSASSFIRPTRYPLQTQEVHCQTLETVFKENQITHCSLLKMDIESFEYEALMGAKELLKEGVIHRIVIEFHPNLLEKRGKSVEDILSLLDQCNYKRVEGFEADIFEKIN